MKPEIILKTLFAIILFTIISCTSKTQNINTESQKLIAGMITNTDTNKLSKAVFGAGCFWCVETIFQDIKGVISVVPGYSGGTTINPSYEEVCTGQTGHAEVIQITFDSSLISFDNLLDVFWHVHDPTTLNKQGSDIGTQYRSVIFYGDELQKTAAENSKKKTDDLKLWDNPIVTEILKLDIFYEAEEYHRNYFRNNPDKAYCSLIIAPKVKKFYKEFQHLLKDEVKK